MKVKLLRQKRLHPNIYQIGEIADIPDGIARRWIDRGIAESIEVNTNPIKTKPKLHAKVSIVILVKDALKYFKLCLESVIKYTFNYELIIVDNGSSSLTKKYIAEQQAKFGFTLITNRDNRGFSYGNDQAIRVANCDYICFLNSDCVVTKSWLSRLMEGFDYPDAGIVGSSTGYCGGDQCIRSLMAKHDSMTIDEINAIRLEPGIVETELMGFCYLAKREVIDRIGVFDYKRYGLGLSEEKDFNYRAKKAGFRLYWIKDVYVHHFGNKTFKEIGIDPYKFLSKNRAILADRIKNDPNIFIENDSEITEIIDVKKNKTDVIIAVLDREIETTKTLKSLFKNNDNINVTIIDNGSDNLDYLKQFDVKIVKNRKNQGVTKTLNQGLKLVNSKYVVLMHNDIRIKTRDWITKAIEFMEANGDVGIVGQAGWKKIRKDAMCGRESLRTSIEIYDSKPHGDFEEVVTLDGCCNVIRNIGLVLDETLGYYFYDFDMSMQYRDLGFRLFVMDGSAVHFADDRKKATINIPKYKRPKSEENIYWRQSINYFLSKWSRCLPSEIK